MNRTITYVYGNTKHNVSLKFSIEGTHMWTGQEWRDRAEDMLVSLFNDQYEDWNLITHWEEEGEYE